MLFPFSFRHRGLTIALLICMAHVAVFAVQGGNVQIISDQSRLQAVTLAYPGARLNPNGTIVIPQKDGSLKTALLNGLSRRPVPKGLLYIAGIDIQQDQERVSSQLAGTTPVPDGSANSKVVVFYTDSRGTVTSSKVAVLDPKAASTAISDFYWEVVPTDGSFPIIRVLYDASYHTSEFVAVIRWAAKINTADMSLQERVPVTFVESRKDGTVRQDYLTSSRVDSGHIQIVSAMSGATVRYPCADVCIVDPLVLLNRL